MRKDRDVFDYAALGLSAAQAYKLTEIAAEMGKLREAVEDEQRRNRRLGQMRQMVIMTEELLDRLESDINFAETSLQKQFAMAYEIEASLKLAGVLPPNNLDSWEDQDRVRRVERRIDTFGMTLLRRMPDDQRREAELCLQYMAEEPDLGRLIMVRSGRQSFRRNRGRLDRLEAKLKAEIKASPGTRMIRGMARVGLWLVGLSTVGIMAAGCLEGEHIVSIGKGVGFLLVVMLLGGCGLYLGQFFLRALTLETLVPHQIRKLEAKRKELKSEIGISQEGQRVSPFERMAALAGDKIDVNALTAKFGGKKPIGQLRKMYAQRRTFVRRIIGPQYLRQQDGHEAEDRS